MSNKRSKLVQEMRSYLKEKSLVEEFYSKNVMEDFQKSSDIRSLASNIDDYLSDVADSITDDTDLMESIVEEILEKIAYKYAYEEERWEDFQDAFFSYFVDQFMASLRNLSTDLAERLLSRDAIKSITI